MDDEAIYQTYETLKERYENYLAHADNGQGIDVTTGKPLKTFDEWLNS